MDVAIAILFTVFLGLLAKLIWHQPRSGYEPPCISGWMPWIGAAFAFGKAPLNFIEEARLKCGPIFTIYMLGKRYTFLSGEEGLQAFCTSKDADFEQAVQQSVKHAVSVPEEIFYKNRSNLYILVKEKLSQSNLHDLSEKYCQELQKEMEDLAPESTEELRDLIRGIMFPASVNILFGKDTFLARKDHIKEFKEYFQNYDEDFEYATQLPECFMKKWSQSKKWLIKRFEKVVLHLSDGDSKTLLQYVLETLQGKDYSANYGLLLLWASQANAVPATFWTLAFILSHPPVYKNVMKEIESVYGKSDKENIQITTDDLKKFPFIKWCVLETLRLRPPGAIVKKVVNPMKVQKFVIPAGDQLMISPYWIHRNPEYFPEPQLFKPERWREANVEKNSFLKGFVAFGGGAHQCPGRWFAIMEIQLLVVLFLSRYECVLLDPLPKESFLHLVGTQQPEGSCRIHYKLKA